MIAKYSIQFIPLQTMRRGIEIDEIEADKLGYPDEWRFRSDTLLPQLWPKSGL
ncbi:hypothetical protein [Fusibacter sp. 3D3]|uniref:hypothetical protein n=1 Tax=Fusibacter sp. 3D3 TaxID=1048380 RepID=UPI000857AC97|nr:hypothetical protein [Fusibacter sp. 3D3]GAU77960.1 hypothetical protein F3D3_2589 [Fusibacter sp. 3D3]